MLQYIVTGLATGGSYALLGLALTITHRATRTVNFAIAGIGTIGTFAMSWADSQGLPFALALLLGVAVGGLLGALLGSVLVRLFGEASVETKSVVTIAVFVSLLALGGLVWKGKAVAVPSKLLSPAFRVGGTPVSQSSVVIISLAVLLALGISFALSHTVMGKRLQAVSERSTTAELLGIDSRRYGLVVWAVSGAFSVVAIWLIASKSATEFSGLTLYVIPALAAALVGLFHHLGWTVVGGLLIGALRSIVAGTDRFQRYSSVVPFVFFLAILLWSQRNKRWDESR
jgi:branched-chain amino acid transport system permease protein